MGIDSNMVRDRATEELLAFVDTRVPIHAAVFIEQLTLLIVDELTRRAERRANEINRYLVGLAGVLRVLCASNPEAAEMLKRVDDDRHRDVDAERRSTTPPTSVKTPHEVWVDDLTKEWIERRR